VVVSQGVDDHAVMFCSTDAELTDAATEYLIGSLRSGGAAIAVATPPRLRQIERRITQAGIDPGAARASGTYQTMDASAAMAEFLTGGWPDAAAFWRTISPVVGRASAGHRRVCVFGEMVSLLWTAGQRSAAIEIEALWNELARQYQFSLLCAYVGTGGAGPDLDDELALVVTAHTRIAPVG
jgi:MEDS: MEthanogen/methylotroph, DcmR Sensory domain